MRAFIKAGVIEVETFANARRVTIMRTGKRTRYERGSELPLEQDVLPRPVDRTPCPRCGTRKDIGCDHQRPGDDAMRLTSFPHVRGLR